jgi:hypothetical protein
VSGVHLDSAPGDPVRGKQLTEAFQIFAEWPIEFVDAD